MANQEGHYIKSFGPKLLIETGNPQMGVGGKESAGIKATNDSGERFVIKHTESGLSRIEAEDRLEIVGGEKNDGNKPSIIIHTPNGDIDIKVEDGFFKVKATNICFEAEDSIVFKAGKIQMGDEKQTKDIIISGQRVEYKTKKGNLAAALKTDSMLASFAGSFVSDQVESLVEGIAGGITSG